MSGRGDVWLVRWGCRSGEFAGRHIDRVPGLSGMDHRLRPIRGTWPARACAWPLMCAAPEVLLSRPQLTAVTARHPCQRPTGHDAKSLEYVRCVRQDVRARIVQNSIAAGAALEADNSGRRPAGTYGMAPCPTVVGKCGTPPQDPDQTRTTNLTRNGYGRDACLPAMASVRPCRARGWSGLRASAA